MSLEAEEWTPVAVPEIIWAFLKAEAHKFELQSAGELITHPNFDDAAENEKRVELVCRINRDKILGHIPSDTSWFKVEFLQNPHLHQLLFIGSGEWISDKDRNEFGLLPKRWPHLELKKHPSEWPPTILWGHSKAGPFTILEGNHRYLAVAFLEQKPEVKLAVYVGLSNAPCVWHRPDQNF